MTSNGLAAATGGAYESRVLEGIWAAAPPPPHGSVPTLAQLLTPAAQRVQTFAGGPDYDEVNIGLTPTQTQFDYTIPTGVTSASIADHPAI
jgi:hypothetical protein